MTELLPRKAKRRIWSLRRRDGPKSRQLHYGEHVQSGYVSPPNPRIKSQNPKGGFGALWLLFPLFLSTQKGGPRRALDTQRGW